LRGKLHGLGSDSRHWRTGSFGRRFQPGKSDSQQQHTEWPLTALHDIYDVVHRQSDHDPRESHHEGRFRIKAGADLYRQAGYYHPLTEDRNLFVLFNANTGQIMPNTTPWYKSNKTNFGPRLAFTFSPTSMNNKTVLRVGAGYFYGPGQTEDQIQPIDSDRASANQSGA